MTFAKFVVGDPAFTMQVRGLHSPHRSTSISPSHSGSFGRKVTSGAFRHSVDGLADSRPRRIRPAPPTAPPSALPRCNRPRRPACPSWVRVDQEETQRPGRADHDRRRSLPVGAISSRSASAPAADRHRDGERARRDRDAPTAWLNIGIIPPNGSLWSSLQPAIVADGGRTLKPRKVRFEPKLPWAGGAAGPTLSIAARYTHACGTTTIMQADHRHQEGGPRVGVGTIEDLTFQRSEIEFRTARIRRNMLASSVLGAPCSTAR